MSDFPDFSGHGYQVVRELGHNRAGGRVTYLATRTALPLDKGETGGGIQGVPVVIKQFQFAQFGASWAQYEAFEQEIKVLRSLNHPGIPRYLDSFQMPDGFCMVQEYKDAECLGSCRDLYSEEIKKIAVAVLEILVYLQSQKPPVIHRDLKQENILVDKKRNVYLVDFGFARVGGGDVAVSSVVKGTLGFMPPEQLFNRQLTEASDLYSLGATLICLLTGTKSVDIGNLVDGAYRFPVKKLLPNLNPEFIGWLQKTVEPNVKYRYPNAAAALQAMQWINVYISIQEGRPSNKVSVPILIALLLGSVGVGYALVGVSALFSEGNSKKVEFQKLDYQAYSQVTVTTGLDETFKPVDSLKEISLNSKAVYFYVSFHLDFQKPTADDKPLPPQTLNSSCKLFNPAGTLVYEGESSLIAEGNRLDTWCLHEFDQEADKPGNWKFEFYLDDKKVATENLAVLSQ
ncbi:MAG: serine/threonine protein kinase [Oscillatoria princeps RMCB-10]|jgi:serine/threonine protein kinase|nr:serine/threonine protein kinase [Oscillatoria princeps RMCB-10]